MTLDVMKIFTLASTHTGLQSNCYVLFCLGSCLGGILSSTQIYWITSSPHIYPLAKGSAIPILDQGQYGNSGKTEYSHTSSQCCEWIPTKIGLDA